MLAVDSYGSPDATPPRPAHAGHDSDSDDPMQVDSDSDQQPADAYPAYDATPVVRSGSVDSSSAIVQPEVSTIFAHGPRSMRSRLKPWW